MTIPVKIPILPVPPETYDLKYMQDLLRVLNEYMRVQNAIGPVVGSDATFVRLPTSSTGLRSGQLYAEADGIVRIVA